MIGYFLGDSVGLPGEAEVPWRMHSSLGKMPAMKAVSCVLFLALSVAGNARFEPYAANGGSVAAIAGEDFAMVAADAQLVEIPDSVCICFWR